MNEVPIHALFCAVVAASDRPVNSHSQKIHTLKQCLPFHRIMFRFIYKLRNQNQGKYGKLSSTDFTVPANAVLKVPTHIQKTPLR